MRTDRKMKRTFIIRFAAVSFIVIFLALCMIIPSIPHNYEIALSPDEITEISIVEIDENNKLNILKELPSDSDIIEKIEELECSRLVPPSYDFIGKGLLITYSQNRYELILECINSYYEGGQDQWNGDKSDWGTEAFHGTGFDELLTEYLAE